MFFILSKALIYICFPFFWVVCILLYSVFTKNQKRRKRSLITVVVMIFFFGSQYIVNEGYKLWERGPVPIATLKTYDTAIVLTGITDSQRKPHDRVYLTRGADRLMHTIQLYKLGKVKKILISGGSGMVFGKKVSEAGDLKKVALICGVAENDILIEDKSRNTHESSVMCKHLVDSLGIKGNYLLITSAFHMRRSEGCFTRAGFKVDIFPTDFYTRSSGAEFDDLIPSDNALGKWSVLIHEIIGYWTYKLMGYA